ncbi:hypothetical protein M141_3506 [Bacteroides fragilis str. S38L5]|nr:hypothetical protein M141_3506 [Bacteroides fragilis str. S38L5]
MVFNAHIPYNYSLQIYCKYSNMQYTLKEKIQKLSQFFIFIPIYNQNYQTNRH